MTVKRDGRLAALLAAATMLSACGGEPANPQGARPEAARATPIAEVPTDALRARATQALAARRHFAPAGDNAVELLLALRERGRQAPGDAMALTELQPELVIAVEQAIDRRDAGEAQRLLDLLARVDANAPAIPRLRVAVQGAREAAAAALAARSDAEARAREQALRDAAPATAATARPRVPAPATAMPAVPSPATAPPPAEAPRVAAAEAPAARALEPAPERAPEPPMRTAPALRLVQDAQPRYPARALERRLDGRVEIMFTVRTDGSVADLRVVDAQPAGVFDQAALQAARRWRFAPIPADTTTTRALRFTPPRG